MKRPAPLAGLFLVNAASLAFEVAASREAAAYLGATAYANALLLAAFLAGIGMGGCAAALPSVERRPTRSCGWLLVIAGVLAAGLAPALGWLEDAGPAGMLPRGSLLAALVLPVGLAVGLAYPVLTALFAAGGSMGRASATTYAADTLGAACGSLAAGFLLIPAFGLRATGVIAGLGLLAVGLGVMAAPAPPVAAPTRKKLDPSSPAVTRLVLGLFFVTGLAALALEVAWIRLFTLVVGTSLFSFSLTVAAFLAALGLGSQAMRRRAEAVRDPARALARILIVIGATAPTLLLLSPFWERLYLAAYRAAGHVALFEAAVFALGLASILAPAGLMGAAFPLGVRLVASGSRSPAGSVGRLYGINTLGGVLGALLCGLLLLPALGVRGAVLASALLYLLAGVVLNVTLASGGRRLTHTLTAAASGVVLAVWLAPEPGFSFAPYYHGLRLGGYAEFAATRRAERVLYRRFSPYGLVTASADADHRYLRHNGRSEASTSPTDMSTQLLIAHLPLLMHPGPARVLNIGLGAGFTLGAIEQHPEPVLIVQAELDPRIVEAARLHFEDVNGSALSDPRLRLHVTDGRKLLAHDPTLYDVIVSEPSHLWVSGVSGLFTAEFYRIAAARLAPRGVFATWVPRYEMGSEEIRIVAATLLDQFLHVTAFENGPFDIIFLASRAPLAPRLERVRSALSAPGVHADIGRALAGFPLGPESLTSLLEQVAANASAMPASVTPDTPRNTDDRPVLEFRTALAAIGKRTTEAPRSP